ncbi:MAG TPA: protein kinase [Planctomycetota bacterium]|nr:protein kinase [Planctomycetota bacterium]
MSASYETTFLAIASKNKLITQEEAAQCLADYNKGAAEGQRRAIEEIIQETGLLTGSQIRALSAAAAKLAGQSASSAAIQPPPVMTRPPSGEHAPARPATSVPAKPADPNEPIPGIRISGKLGVGGTATVFLAEEKATGRKLALKIIHPKLAKDEKAVRRFEREAQLLCEFKHANLVQGHSQGKMGPLSYFLMEALDGESVQEQLDREKRINEARALEIILEAAKAIDYMQSKGIVHRDIKPDNLYLCRDGAIKVIDLGFAQPMHGDGEAVEEETTSGTAQYMSPEQARGARDLDVRADIYSLGATLYHMVMGELPFTGTDSLEVMAKQVMEALNGNMKNQGVSKHMHYFIERMMSKDKDLRYSTPRELIDDVNEQIEGFKSLVYKPEEGEQTQSKVMRIMEGPGSTTTRRIRLQNPGANPATTRRMSKLDEIRARLKKK